LSFYAESAKLATPSPFLSMFWFFIKHFGSHLKRRTCVKWNHASRLTSDSRNSDNTRAPRQHPHEAAHLLRWQPSPCRRGGGYTRF